MKSKIFAVLFIVTFSFFSGSIHVFARSSDYEKRAALKKAQKIVATVVKSQMTDFEKTLVLYEYITDRLVYGKYKGRTSAYTALIYNKADCVGFARGLHLLYETAGLDSFVVVRRKGHLWVKVKLDGKYYNIDPTWGALKSRWPQYSWFLLSDEQNIDQDKGIYHILDSGEKYPPADMEFVFKNEYYINKQLLRSRQKLRILGEVIVPDDVVVPDEGLIGYVNGNRFKIPAGKKSVFFMTMLSRKSRNNPYIKYSLKNDKVENLTKSGYYSEIGSVLNKEDAYKLNLVGNDIAGIKLILKEAKHFICGNILMPNKLFAPKKGLNFSIELTCYRGKKRIRYYDQVYIPEGEISSEFRIDIDERDSDKKFYLYYYSPKAVKYGYEKVGYYSKNGTVTESKEKEYFEILGRKSSVNLQVKMR